MPLPIPFRNGRCRRAHELGFWVAQRFSAAIRLPDETALAAEVPMAAPHRGNTGFGTYFITASTFQKQSLFQSDKMANLILETLFNYRSQQKYLLHEFVIMPDHFHLLLTPTQTLERALQLIKGGFSFRAKKELGFTGEIWETSYYDRRVRDLQEYYTFRQYIHSNPVKKGLAGGVEQYPYSSAKPGLVLDAVPQRLKPSDSVA
jgi:putative transposase